jgi:hypothetical protein
MAEIDPDLRRDDEEENAAPSRILTGHLLETTTVAARIN